MNGSVVSFSNQDFILVVSFRHLFATWGPKKIIQRNFKQIEMIQFLRIQISAIFALLHYFITRDCATCRVSHCLTLKSNGNIEAILCEGRRQMQFMFYLDTTPGPLHHCNPGV